MSTGGVFFLNNTYYYSTAKRMIQKQKKRVRFRFDAPAEKMPLNCSDFQEVDSYVAPVKSIITFNNQYPAEFIPRGSRATQL